MGWTRVTSTEKRLATQAAKRERSKAIVMARQAVIDAAKAWANADGQEWNLLDAVNALIKLETP